MKRQILIFAMLFVFYSLYAQTEQVFDSISNKEITTYPKHEIGFSIGALPIIGVKTPDTGPFPFDDPVWHKKYIKGDDGMYENMYHLGSYTFNYNYHLKFKHSIGVSLSWVGIHVDTYVIYYPSLFTNNDDTIDGKGWKHYFTLQGNYRNTYYHKNKISLYWGIHGGITLCTRDRDILPKETLHFLVGSTSNDRYYFTTGMHISAFGIEIGKKHVFNMELGIGTQGFVKAGYRYKF